MPQPTLITTIQKFLVTDVGGVGISDIVADGTGKFVREVRIVGVADADNPSPPIVLTLRLSAASKDGITVKTPQLSF